MAVRGERKISIQFTGDGEYGERFDAVSNASSPGAVEVKRLAIGDNTVTVPTAGFVPSGCTILPPAGNTNTLTLKGVGADTGIRLHNTDPTSLGIWTTVATFVINASAQTDVRLIWT